jgi:predicted transposase/invertase (TIGR01784 family)
MLLTEWNSEDARKVWREEALEEGLEKGREKGRVEREIEIARNLLAKGSTFEFIRDVTGLDIETIQSLKT